MKKIFLFTVMLLSSQLYAATDEQRKAIENIGELNGVALQCSYIDKVRVIKLALVKNLPKQRILGQWFEDATNKSFINFMETGKQCPRIDLFSTNVDAAISQIEVEFRK